MSWRRRSIRALLQVLSMAHSGMAATQLVVDHRDYGAVGEGRGDLVFGADSPEGSPSEPSASQRRAAQPNPTLLLRPRRCSRGLLGRLALSLPPHSSTLLAS
jgi:hypothetical protein